MATAPPEIRAYKAVWRDAKLIAVERDTFARKFTVRPGVVAYMFAVPTRVFELFRVDQGVRHARASSF